MEPPKILDFGLGSLRRSVPLHSICVSGKGRKMREDSACPEVQHTRLVVSLPCLLLALIQERSTVSNNSPINWKQPIQNVQKLAFKLFLKHRFYNLDTCLHAGLMVVKTAGCWIWRGSPVLEEGPPGWRRPSFSPRPAMAAVENLYFRKLLPTSSRESFCYLHDLDIIPLKSIHLITDPANREIKINSPKPWLCCVKNVCKEMISGGKSSKFWLIIAASISR